MFLIGLTGGIAAGKTTVAELWKSLGAIEIDADQVARDVVVPGSVGARQIEAQFGSEYFDETGNLDRKKLGKYVFANPEARSKLEEIIHPLVRDRTKKLIAVQPAGSIIVYSVPLLVEAKVDLPFDAVVTVEAPEEIRIQRLVSSRGMTETEATNRVAAQASPVERAQHADYILNSNQDLALLLRDAKQLFAKFIVEASSK